MKLIEINLDEYIDFLNELVKSREVGCIVGTDEDGEFCINLFNNDFQGDEDE